MFAFKQESRVMFVYSPSAVICIVICIYFCNGTPNIHQELDLDCACPVVQANIRKSH